MTRKEQCENVVLSKTEKKLLKRIKRHPHLRCDPETVRPLYVMGLVEPDTLGVDAFGAPDPLDTYCIAPFYDIYKEHLREQRSLLVLRSVWLPIVVAVTTEIVVHALSPLWPLLQQWFASCLQAILS